MSNPSDSFGSPSQRAVLSDRQRATYEYYSAFAMRDYQQCLTYAPKVLATQPTPSLMQLFVISLQRLGRLDLLAEASKHLLELTASSAWEHGLARITLGNVNIEELLKVAETENQRCRAHFYAGARLLTLGLAAEARGRFRRCSEFNVICIEHTLAAVEYKSLAIPVVCGVDDPEQQYGILFYQASELEKMGWHKYALRAAKHAYDICCDKFGEQHRSAAIMLGNIGALYARCGEFARSEAMQAKAIEYFRAQPSGEQQALDVGTLLSNYAMLQKDLGRYVEAERYYQESLRLLSAHEDLRLAHVRTVSNLAQMHMAIGDVENAIPLMCKAESKLGLVHGERDLLSVTLMNNLAVAYYSVGRVSSAQQKFDEALESAREGLGDEHPALATLLGNVGMTYAKGSLFRRAVDMVSQSLGMRRALFGDMHHSVAESLSLLGGIYFELGEYTSAEACYDEAAQIVEVVQERNHPQYGEILVGRAEVLVATERPWEALELLDQATRVGDRLIGQVFSFGSEGQRASIVDAVHRTTHVMLTMVWRYCGRENRAVLAVMDLIQRRKAVLAEAHATQREVVLGGAYPQLKSRLADLSKLRMQIARKQLAGPGSGGRQTHLDVLEEWEAERNRIEAALAREIPEMNLQKQLDAADHRAIALHLDEETALVEFVRFLEFDFHTVAKQVDENRWEPACRWKDARYLAFVLFGGEPDNVQMIDLGDAEPIDRMIEDFRAGINGEGRGLGAAEAASTSNLDDVGAMLRESVFDPLRKVLGSRTRIIISPDGGLSRLPFEVLPTVPGRHLVDEYCFSYVTVGRDVMRFGPPLQDKGPDKAIVVGDPDFDLSSATAPASTDSNKRESDRHRSRDVDRSNLNFSRLAGTRSESKQIGEMLGVEPWLDDQALEAKLKACRSPRILHLATHGFFLKDQQRDPNNGYDYLETMDWEQVGDPIRHFGKRCDNPLLRSGLALAGANTWLAEGNPPKEAEDGLLTAEDVTGINLSDTELVVLSACETGLGEVQVGEGVMGLRRSFTLTGANTVVMSLWKVPDDQTQELMVDFYRRILLGEGRADALRSAQMEMKQKYPDPFYWGAFICQGDPAPLQR